MDIVNKIKHCLKLQFNCQKLVTFQNTFFLSCIIGDPSPLYTARSVGLEVKKVKSTSNMIKLEGSKFEPSIFHLLESQDFIFLMKNKLHEIFFASSPARLAV